MCWTLTHALPQTIPFYSKRLFCVGFYEFNLVFTESTMYIVSVASRYLRISPTYRSKKKDTWYNLHDHEQLQWYVWVVNFRANRVKDALPRDWTVHGPWYLCFGSEMLSTWCSKEKRTRLPSNSFETFCVNGGDLFKRDFPWVQEVTSDSIG